MLPAFEWSRFPPILHIFLLAGARMSTIYETRAQQMLSLHHVACVWSRMGIWVMNALIMLLPVARCGTHLQP